MWRCRSLTFSSVLPVAEAFAASPENYPTRPTKLIVPFGAGSASDFRGRIADQYMAKALGLSIIADNQPGAQGLLGAGPPPDLRRMKDVDDVSGGEPLEVFLECNRVMRWF
jgi:tripartite-type tricarboxylate transporter receptor subunit TctC